MSAKDAERGLSWKIWEWDGGGVGAYLTWLLVDEIYGIVKDFSNFSGAEVRKGVTRKWQRP